MDAREDTDSIDTPDKLPKDVDTMCQYIYDFILTESAKPINMKH